MKRKLKTALSGTYGTRTRTPFRAEDFKSSSAHRASARSGQNSGLAKPRARSKAVDPTLDPTPPTEQVAVVISVVRVPARRPHPNRSTRNAA